MLDATEQQTDELSVLQAAVAKLEKSNRRLKTWVIVLGVIVALAVLMTCAPLVFIPLVAFESFAMSEVDEAQIEAVRSAADDALKGLATDVQVRSVEVMPEDGMGLASDLLLGSGALPVVYVEYRVGSADAVVANMFDPSFGGTLGASGIIPMLAVGDSRMTEEAFVALLRAYSEQSDEPFGGVLRYGGMPSYPMMGSFEESVTIGGERYKAAELWSVFPGRLVEGDEYRFERDVVGSEESLIFRKDPTTGEFTYVGSETFHDPLNDSMMF